jgi:PAS domain S-box-containing protein
MNPKRNTSFQIRLASIAILMLLIALAAMAYSSGRRVETDSDLIKQDAVPGTINAHYMRMAMSRSLTLVLAAASGKTTEFRDGSLKAVHAADVAFDTALKNYEDSIRKSPPEDRSLLEQVKKGYAVFKTKRIAYEALILAGDREGASVFLEHELIPAYLPVLQSAEELLKYNHGNSISLSGAIHRSVSHLYWAVAVVMVLALACALVLVFNLTTRRRELAELEENEEKFSKAFKSTPSGIAITEIETGRFIEVNDSYCRLIGFSPEEVVGHTSLELGIWGSPEERSRRFRPLSTGGSLRDMEINAITRDGSRREVSVNADPIELGGRNCVISSVVDITERKELQRKQAQLAAIVESSDDAIIGKSMEGVITSWNRGAEKIFGYTAAAAVGQPLLMIFPPELVHEDEEILVRIARGETVQHFETVRVCEDGRRIFISATISPLRDGGGNVIGASKIARDITAQKQAEEELRDKQAQLLLAMDIAKLAHWEFDVVKNIVTADEHIFQLLGTTSEQEGGGSMSPEEYIRRFVHPEDAGIVAHEVALGIAADDPNFARQFEHRITRRDGTERVMLVRSQIIMDAGGRTGKILGTNQDITEQKQAELRIRQLNRIYAVLSAINQTIVHEKEPQAMLTKACQIAVEKGGFRMAWVGLHDAAANKLQPVASAGVVEGYLELLNIDMSDKARSNGPSGRCFMSAEHITCHDMEHDPLLAPWREEALKRGYRSSACFPLKVAGRIVGVFMLYSDKTGFFNEEETLLLDELAMDIGFALEVGESEAKRRQAEQELRWRTAFFEAQVHSAIDGILVLDSAGRKLLQNRRMNELWKIPPPIADDPDDSRQLQFVLGQVKEPEVFLQKISHLNAHPYESSTDIIEQVDGTIVERHSAPVCGSDGTYYGRVWTFHDLTERRKLEAQFLRAQRMESIGTLASGVAHDLNNILTPIMMSVAVLRLGLSAEKRDSLCDTIEMSAARGAQIVKQVLTFGRGLEGERHPLQVDMLITEMEQMIRSTFPKELVLECIKGPHLRLVLGDATQIHQVLLNLCVNARDAMPDGGTLRLSATNLEIDASYASMLSDSEAIPGNYVLLEVSDTGGGIPPEILERIFDPFFTTKGVGKGTGLGLSTVHGIVKSHGGFLKVVTGLGKGSTFQIYLPAAPVQGAAVDSAVSAPPPTGHGECVLVVDDELAIVNAARAVLEANGYRVLLANNATEALVLYTEHPQEVSLVLTDIMMPGMNGVLFLRTLRKINPDVPVIASTGLCNQAQLDTLKSLGVETVLHKPYNSNTLLRTIDGVLHPKA